MAKKKKEGKIELEEGKLEVVAVVTKGVKEEKAVELKEKEER